MPITHHGSCHCGRVTFELATDVQRVLECNCSICRRNGTLWTGATDETLHITKGVEDLATYQFGTMKARHYFCKHCGVQPLARPRIDPTRWVVNVRCIAALDLSTLKVELFDGQNWEEAARAFVAAMRA
jgi:hypothetical protein